MDPSLLNTMLHWIQDLVHELQYKGTLIEEYQNIIKKQQQEIVDLQNLNNHTTSISIKLDETRIINEILRKQSQIKLKGSSNKKLTDLLQTAPQRV
jgi:hypothetical protein